MKLYLNTVKSDNKMIELKLEGDDMNASKLIPVENRQTEKALASIDEFLKDNDVSLFDLSEVRACNHGGSYTSLRIGVVIANALAYALGIKVSGDEGDVIENEDGFLMIKPVYAGEPNIG